jgi:hypothetical protein
MGSKSLGASHVIDLRLRLHVKTNRKSKNVNRKFTGHASTGIFTDSYLGLSLVILNGAERSEESLRYPVASQGSRDFSLPWLLKMTSKRKFYYQYL